ncbi:MAG: hypothetical protein E6575_11810, partial [Bradyrhizobium sp.]|nr:hypothetical protein [Bradyrhizobium sp.]
GEYRGYEVYSMPPPSSGGIHIVQILNLLADLLLRRGLAILFITHDISVVSYLADRIAVMHQGKIVESGPASAVLDTPRMAYTRTLLASAPEPVLRG